MQRNRIKWPMLAVATLIMGACNDGLNELSLDKLPFGQTRTIGDTLSIGVRPDGRIATPSIDKQASVVAAPIIVGSDFGGADFTVPNGVALQGTFTNVRNFVIPSGAIVTVAPNIGLTVNAQTIVIDGVLDGTGAGYPGGAAPGSLDAAVGLVGSGPGGGQGSGYGSCVHSPGGAGGSYGGKGGNGGMTLASPAEAISGATYAGPDKGSGGGSVGNHGCGYGGRGARGGNGGALIDLRATVDLISRGLLIADGENGLTGAGGQYPISGSGGGSGGTIRLQGSLTLSGTLRATGGNGGAVSGTAGWVASGAGGGGGRIFLVGCTKQNTAATVVSGGSLAAFVGGVNGNPLYRNPTAGAAGSIQNSAAASSCGPQAQTITFPSIPPQVYDGTYNLNATASSGLPVNYTTVVGGPCILQNATTLKFISAGSCTVTALQNGNSSFLAATPVSQTFTIAQAQQTITFNPIASPLTLPSVVQMVASSTSGLPVSYVTAGACSFVPPNNLQGNTAGDCTVTAVQNGNSSYAAAAPVTQTVTYKQGTVQVNWQNPADIVYGTTLSSVQLNATFTPQLAGQAVYSPGPGAKLGVGTHTLSVVFTPFDNKYAQATAQVQINVTPRPVTFTPQNVSRPFNSTNPPFSYTTSGLAAGELLSTFGSPVYGGPAAATNASSPAGTYEIQMSGLSNPNYQISYGTGTLTITKIATTISLVGTNSVMYDAQPHGLSVTAQANIAIPFVTVTYNGSTTKPTDAGTYTVAATLDNPNFEPASAAGTLTITKRSLNVVAQPKTMTYGDAVPALTFAYSGFAPGDDASVVNGTPVLSTTATSASGAGSYPITVNASSLSATNYVFNAVGNTVTVSKRSAALAYTGETFALTSGPNASSATLVLAASATRADNIGDITLAKVNFVLTPENGPVVRFDNVSLDASGNASKQVSVPAGLYDVQVELASNNFWTAAPSDAVPLAVVVNTTEQRITGGGWVDEAGSKTNFGFTVQSQKNGNPKGNATITFRGNDGFNYRLKTNSWSDGGATYGIDNVDGRARFVANANLQKINALTGEVVGVTSGLTLTVDVLDEGSSDSIGIVITNGSALVKSVSFRAVGGGNIDVKSK